MGIFNADVIINIPPAFFSLQKSGLVRVYLTSVFLLLSVPRCFGDQKPQFDWSNIFFLLGSLGGLVVCLFGCFGGVFKCLISLFVFQKAHSC